MQERFHRVIAIDGPAASGKSSVARALARQLGFVYVNSGGIYRAITWHILQKRIDLEDSERITEALGLAAITCGLQDNESRILIDDVDPADHLRDDCVNENVAGVSQFSAVRQIVADKLHEQAQSHDLIVEGRDIGSVVFPDTPYKFYVDASPEVRLQRRAAQGGRDEIALRDRTDSSRPVSPLVIAKDAYVIDTSHLTIDGVVNQIVARLRQLNLRGCPVV
jgi:cytidylate kinase